MYLINSEGALSNFLKEVTVQVVPNSVCKKAYGSWVITKNMLCAGSSSGGKDSCQVFFEI